MNEEIETEIPQTTDETAAGEQEVLPPATGDQTLPLDVMVTSPIDFRESTVIRNGKGEIHVIHEITLGEVVLSTLIMAMIIFMILDRVIRR